VVASVVFSVSVAVTAEVPAMLTEDGMLQVAGVPVVGVTAQLRATGPVKPPTGVMVMVEVLPVVAPPSTVMLPLFEIMKLLLPAADPLTTPCTFSVWT
jgi:hypothetical protein